MTKALRSSPVPLYLQIEEKMRSDIRSGILRPLDQVMSEKELSHSFGVSRMTARKSLDRLVQEGLLIRRAGKGTFVAPQKIAHGPSTELSFSQAMSALDLPVVTQVLDAGVILAPPAIAHALRQPESASVGFVRRLRFVDGEPAAIHLVFLPQQFVGLLSEDLTGSLNELMVRAGGRVVTSQDTIEAVSVSGEDARLLRVRKASPVIRIEGVGISASLEPLRYTEALYRGDRFRFGVGTCGTGTLMVELKRDMAGLLAD